MAGRERIPVGANDSLERVLDQLRASRAEEVVLDVDERSPLLLSVPNLDSLEETAQRQGLRLAVASTSSKLLNAARVFGLPVIDLAALPAPARARPDPNARLLAGEPLGGEPPAGGVAVAEPPPPARTPPAPVVAFSTVTVGDDPDPDPDDPEDDGWSEPQEPAPPPRRPRRAPAPVARRPRAPRHDPYGQPYPDDDAADKDNAPRRPAARSQTAPPAKPAHEDDAADDRSAIRNRVPAEAGESAIPDEEGWEDGLTADPADWDGPFAPRPGPFAGLRAFWADVRERVAARRAPAPADDGLDDEDAAPAPDDGWDEPPYRAKAAARATPAAPPPAIEADEDEAEPSGDTGELPPPVPARPARTIRPLGGGRFDADRQPTARLRPVAAPRAADDDDDADGDDGGIAYAPARAASNGLLAWALIALLAVALVGLLAAYIIVPRATVTLVARTSTPEVAFNVVVAEIDPSSPQGQPTAERIVVPARRVIVPVSATASRPASGVRLEPDLFAGGPVILTNASTEAVGVPKGTALVAADGRRYLTLDAVTVPAADPFNSGAFGTVSVKVAAETRGSGGNAAIGAVQGRLTSVLFYNNRDAPIAGGSDRRVPVIARADLAAAQAVAEEAVRGKWQAALAAAIPAGGQQLRETAGLGSFRVEFSAREGADGTSVSASVAADATALAYTPAEVEAQARAEAERRITAAARPGEPIVPGSVQIGAPQLANDVPGTLTYRMTATARTRAAIGSEAERAQLARDLANQSDDEANAILARLPGVSNATIAYQTGPFPRRLPYLASHIAIEVAER